MFVHEDGEVGRKRGDELRPGDCVVAPRQIRLPREVPERIDLLRALHADPETSELVWLRGRASWANCAGWRGSRARRRTRRWRSARRRSRETRATCVGCARWCGGTRARRICAADGDRPGGRLAAFAWIFRGLDRDGDGFVPMVIPGVAAAQQTVQLAGGDTVYRSEPIADAPSGFALATNGPRFAAATSGERTAALVALTGVQNPLLHDTGDTQCIACHLATYLTARCAAASGIGPVSLPGRFAGPLARAVPTIAREGPARGARVRLGGNAPAISQRVANDTAAVLMEIEARFPVRRP